MRSGQLVKKFKFFAGSVVLAVSALNIQAQNSLTAADVQRIIAQAVSEAVVLNQKVTVSVLDKEGHVLGTFAMSGAAATTTIRGTTSFLRALCAFVVICFVSLPYSPSYQ